MATATGSTTQQTWDSAGYNLHARLIGGVPTNNDDLFISIIFSFVFLALGAGAVFQWRKPRKDGDVVNTPYKTGILLSLAVSCFFMVLAWWIRAGLAGGSRAKSTFIAEQIFFVIASLIWVDQPALTLTRDEILVEAIQSVLLDGKVLTRPLVPPKGHWISRFTIAARILLILAGALYIYRFSQLPTPADAIPPSSRSSSLRLAASLIVFLIMLLNLMLFAAAVIKYRNRNILSARVLVLVINLFVFIPVLYNFLIVAVTDDFSSLFSSKLFFYFAYIFFPILVILACIALELNVYTASRELKYIIV